MTDLIRPLFDYTAWCAEVRDPALAAPDKEVCEYRRGCAWVREVYTYEEDEGIES